MHIHMRSFLTKHLVFDESELTQIKHLNLSDQLSSHCAHMWHTVN